MKRRSGKMRTYATAVVSGLVCALAVCAGAYGGTLPPADPLAFDPALVTPQTVFIPRIETKLLTFGTRGGRGEINFSFALPPGVSSNAFEFVTNAPSGVSGVAIPGSQIIAPVPGSPAKVQQTVFSPAKPTSRILKFKGCASGCTDTFTVTVTAKDSTNASASKNVQIVLTRAKIRPVIRSISPVATSPAGSPVFGRRFFQINVEPDTYSPEDQGSEVIGIYSGNFRYSLGNSLTQVQVPRLGRDRNLQIVLRNPYGESSPVRITLSPDPNELFPPVPKKASFGQTVVVAGSDRPPIFTRSHGLFKDTSGTDTFPAESGALSIGCTNCSNARGSITTALGCGQVGAVYNGARVNVTSFFGAASVSSEPPRGELLGTGQSIKAAWDRGQADMVYEMVFSIFFVEGVCAQRVR